MIRLTILLITTLVLASCASIPTEYKSPCACLYEPINEATDRKATA